MALIAIDPGKVTGIAVFNGRAWDKGELISATICTLDECRLFIENNLPSSLGIRCYSGDCVIEVPHVYAGHLQKGDQNDLISLAVMVGRYAEIAESRGCSVRLVKPAEWKGQLPKDVCWQRVRETLKPHELESIAKVSKSKAHNMHDAIGIGTWFQKRWR